MKGALAAALVAAAQSREEKLAGDVVVACVIDEELGSAGTEWLVASRTADAAIVCEPTDERVCVAHKGFVGFEVETRGRAAHGSRPDLGVDAIAAMGPVLAWSPPARRYCSETAPATGCSAPGRSVPSLIEGGQGYSSLPTALHLLSGERRAVPGESLDEIRARDARPGRSEAAEVQVTMSRSSPFPGRPPLPELPQQLARCAGGGGFHGVGFWTDAALLAEAGVPTVLYGPSGAGAHATEEWVELASLERCARVYQEAR